MQPLTWREMFTHMAGYAPESVGVNDENSAQKHLLMLRAMQTAQPTTSDPNYDSASETNFGRVGQGTGTRPTK